MEPTWMHEVMYFIKTGETSGSSPAPIYTYVDYDNAFNPATNMEEYAAKYKARKNQPKYKVTKSISIEFDFDLVEGNALTEWLEANELGLNVPTEIIRVYPRPSGSPVEYPALKAGFVMNANMFDGEANAPLRATGTLDMVDDGWTEGTATITVTQGVPTVTFTAD